MKINVILFVVKSTNWLLSKLSDTIIGRIMKLLSMSMPFGMPIANFQENYKLNYHESLNMESFRSNINDLFESIAKDLPIEIVNSDGQDTVFVKPKQDFDEWLMKCNKQKRFTIITTILSLPQYVVLPGKQRINTLSYHIFIYRTYRYLCN